MSITSISQNSENIRIGKKNVTNMGGAKNVSIMPSASVDNEKAQSTETLVAQVMQTEESVRRKCKALNIKADELKILCPKIAELSNEKFESLSLATKLKIYNSIDVTLDNLLEIKETTGLSSDVNIREIIKVNAQIRYKSYKNGIVNRPEELQPAEGKRNDVNAQLGGRQFKNLDRAEKRARIRNYAKHSRAKFEQELKKVLAELPPEQRAEVEAKMREKYRTQQQLEFLDVLSAQDSEAGLEALAILNANDMGSGANTLMQTRSTKAEAERVANKVLDYSFQEDLIQAYGEMGESPSLNAVQDYNTAFTSYMHQEALNRYQKDYLNSRKSFEGGKCSPYMKEEYYTSIAKGIGKGAYQNVTMSNEEKAEFLAKWELDAKGFRDYDEVTAYIKDEIAKNPELATLYKEAKSKILTARNKTKESATSKERKNTYNTDKPKEDVESGVSGSTIPLHSDTTRNSVVTNPISQNLNVRQSSANSEEEVSVNPYKTYQDITNELANTSFHEAIKKYNKQDVATVILANNDLKHFYPQILPLLKSADVQVLSEMTKYATTEGFLMVLRNITPDKAGKLYDLNNHRLCYAARHMCENALDKNRKPGYAYC